MQLMRIIFSRSRVDVIFYYPQLFNRSADGTNPYFKPLIDICKKNDIKYIALEEPAPGCGRPRDSHSIYADAIYWFVWLMHKILIRWLHLSLHEADQKAGNILDTITFHRLRAKTYITISNSMIDVLGEINPRGNVYDLQHGIIYFGHLGYFIDKERLRPEFLVTNRRVLLWGNLYKKNLRKLPQGINADDKFIVGGYPLYQQITASAPCNNKRILVSLQFTCDLQPDVLNGMKEMLDEFVAEACNYGYEILLKHHPRFANEVDLSPLIAQYADQVKLTTDSLTELAQKVKLHVTWGSTTTMEFAAYGIPTFLLRDYRFDWATEMFYAQYSYPLYDGMTLSDVLKRIDSHSEYTKDSNIIKEWYESAYSPLNENLLLKILKGEQQ